MAETGVPFELIEQLGQAMIAWADFRPSHDPELFALWDEHRLVVRDWVDQLGEVALTQLEQEFPHLCRVPEEVFQRSTVFGETLDLFLQTPAKLYVQYPQKRTDMIPELEGNWERLKADLVKYYFQAATEEQGAAIPTTSDNEYSRTATSRNP